VNEPQARFVPLDTLKAYYRQAYNIVRKHSANTYVVMSELLWDDPNNLVDLGKEFENAIIDLHYYNAFGPTFANMNIQQNIDFIYKQRMQEIERLNANSNGLLSFVGMYVQQRVDFTLHHVGTCTEHIIKHMHMHYRHTGYKE
jgi:hypothetical protein